jgi:hypothetical protein
VAKAALLRGSSFSFARLRPVFYSTALSSAIGYALTPAEAKTIPLTEEPATWPNLGVIVDRLVGRYSELLDIRIPAFARMRFSLNLSDAKGFGKNLRH